jgi:hypothetical protein
MCVVFNEKWHEYLIQKTWSALISGTDSVVEGEKFRSAVGIAGSFAEIQLQNLLTALLSIDAM